jgi:hypothetical protein
MRKIKLAAAALAMAAGLLAAPAAASAASAASIRPDSPGYTLTSVGICFAQNGCQSAWVSLYVYSTYSYDQIWINGAVGCNHGGGWVVSWCSNTNNGKSYLNVGMNWMGTIGIPSGGYDWWRVNIFANDAGCDYWYTTEHIYINNYECQVAQ